MSIPPRYLDELRNRLPISDVIGKRMKLTRAGRELKGCCPFHKEKTPSFTVNDDKQFYHCFGCGAHGDIIGFVMEHDNLSFIDAVEMLSSEAGMTMPKPDPQAMERAKEAKDHYALMEAATGWFEAQLHAPANSEVMSYLTKRGLSPETIKTFRLGFAPGDHQALRTHLKAEGFEDKDMIALGLTKASQKSGDPYVFFRDRVVFPVIDRRQRVIAFGGRILPDNLLPPRQDGFTPPKYLNSPDTPLFDKSRCLYGEATARPASGDGHTIIVVEGYMDVIACYQAGFHAAVAPMGTALTEEQTLSIWKMIADEDKSPVLCFDGDRAGQQAAVRAFERILPMLKPMHSARFAFMPQGEDPDSIIKSGSAAAMKKILKASLTMAEFMWRKGIEERAVDTPEARAGAIQALHDQVNTIQDKNVQSLYRQLIKRKVSDTFFARNNQSRFSGRKSKPSGPAVRPAGVRNTRNLVITKALLAALVNHPQIFDQVEEALASLEMAQPNLGHLRSTVVDLLAEDAGLDRESLQTHLIERGLGKEMDDILSESVYVHAAFARPGADSALVAQNWMEMFGSLAGQTFQNEIKEGWRQAFDASNTEEEDKLRHMLQQKRSELQ